MAYPTTFEAPRRFQFEPSSGSLEYSQKYNCGPTCVTQMAGFYNNYSAYSIEATRRLVTGAGTPTSCTQQRDMLIKRGIPASVRQIDTVAQLHQLVDSSRRPVLIGVQMSRVSDAVKGHNFDGWHAILVIGPMWVNGVKGFRVTDPNFSPPGGIRPDPTRGNRFYSDSVMQSAFINNYPRWTVVPDSAKPIPSATSYVKFNSGVDGVRLRTSPDSRKANIYATVWAAPTGIRLGTERNGKWIGSFGAKRTLYAKVRGADGYDYNKLKLAGTGIYTYVQSRFMHRYYP